MTRTPASPTSALVAALRARLQGRILEPDSPDYAAARRVWNGAINRHPAAIAECADAEDAAWALRLAREHGSALTVRGGGHNVAGRGVRDGALLIDLSRLRSVVVNSSARIATVQGGARWADVDEATAAHGLATTGGLISSTGVGGFTLGGGTGWLMRRYGLASDNVVGASVVLADGRTVRANASENSELFWGLRGGGSLGIVTAFDFRLHELTQVVAGFVVHPAAEAAQVLRRFRDFASDASDEFCGVAVITSAPPLPFLDPAWHGRPVVILALCWCGAVAAADEALRPLTQASQPLGLHVGAMPYVQWQKMLDPSAPAGLCHYWKTASFAALDDAVIGRIAAAAMHLPTPQTEIHVQHLGGAVARVPVRHSAFAAREARFFVNFIGVAPTPDAFTAAREGVRALHAQCRTAALATMLPNFADGDDGDVIASDPAPHAEQLRRVRQLYDPDGVFAAP